MTVSKIVAQRKRALALQLRRSRLPHAATFVLFGALGFWLAIAVAWLTGQPAVSDFFQTLACWQADPHWLLVLPDGSYLRAQAAAIAACAGAVGVALWRSPQPRRWSLAVVVAVLSALTLRYVAWRVGTTLVLEHPASGLLSLTLLVAEVPFLLNGILVLFLLLGSTDSRAEADRHAAAVAAGQYQPAVDVLVPTYNEPLEILRRTAIGCLALDYPRKTVYLLDDGRRPEVRALAAELGCRYLARSDNRHAKAGNLNHALPRTSGELIAVFDADFVPVRTFLQRTVGFFQNPKTGLVQTYQHFYNPDPVLRNLGWADRLTSALESFSRYVGPLRDGAAAAMCSGTSFVVRRSALAEAGNFVTASLGEDYFTGTAISARGYAVRFLDEGLSAGLSAESMAGYAAQFQRWCTGSMQAFFLHWNPLTVPGLTLRQRLGHLQGLLFWFSYFPQALYLLLPLGITVLSLVPNLQVGFFRATPAAWALFFLPVYALNLATTAWLNRRSASALMSQIYSVAVCFPVCLTILQTLVRPFQRGFRVTPKGLSRDRYQFSLGLAWPLLLAWGGTTLALGSTIARGVFLLLAPGGPAWSDPQTIWVGVGLFWLGLNWILLSLTLLAYVDAPKPDRWTWFQLSVPARLAGIASQGSRGEAIARTERVSEGGLVLVLSEGAAADGSFAAGDAAIARIDDPRLPDPLALPVRVAKVERESRRGRRRAGAPSAARLRLHLRFEALSSAQSRRVVEWLFCQPGQWARRETPGEWATLGLMLRSLVRPRWLQRDCDRREAVPLVAKSS